MTRVVRKVVKVLCRSVFPGPLEVLPTAAFNGVFGGDGIVFKRVHLGHTETEKRGDAHFDAGSLVRLGGGLHLRPRNFP